jgi:hypothetical protein
MNQTVLVIAASIFVLAALIFIKTRFFYRATRKRTLKRWLYFNQFHIMDASSEKIKNLRRTQNILSIIILVVFLLSIIINYIALSGA